MCNNENAERTIKPQFRVHLTEKLTNSNDSSGVSSTKSIFLANSQCPKSPAETLVPSLGVSNSSGVTRNITTHQNLTIPSGAAAGRPPGVMSSMLGNAVVPPGLLPPLDHYRLQLYNYAMVERLRCSQYPGPLPICPPAYSAAAAVNSPYGPRFALSMSLFHNRVFQPEEPKPQHSYIGLIAMAILSSPESKLVLSDIYQHILDNYPYFRTRGPGWRNSIRHNLSLNDCFIKAGRSANGKGHYWAIHPANLEDFKKGDFRRRKAQRKVRKHMGLAVDDEGTDSPSPPPLAVTPPPHSQGVVGPPFCPTSWAAAAAVASGRPTAGVMANIYSQSRKRQFDVASLLAPDDDNNQRFTALSSSRQHLDPHQTFDSTQQFLKAPMSKKVILTTSSDVDEDIDVVASDAEENPCQKSQPTLSSLPPYSDQQDDETQILELHPEHGQSVQPDSFQLIQQEDTAGSPISQQDEDVHQTPSSPNAWQGFIQQWPNNFNPLGVSAAMDPRILGRYYGQYMAAAAAQQAVAVRHQAAVVGNFLNGNATVITTSTTSNSSRNGTPLESNSSVVDASELQPEQQQQHHHHHHQHQQQPSSELNLPGSDC